VTIELLRAASRAPLPWKNGGGVTSEVAAHPPGSGFDALDWRVSIAQVRAAGPFSSLPGLDRRLAVLEGTLSIAIDRAPPVQISPDTPALHFPGEVPVQAQPVGGAVTDLNVMTRRGRFSSVLTLHRARQVVRLANAPGSVLLVAQTDLVLRSETAAWHLGALDGARLEGGATCEVHPQADEARFYVIQLRPAPSGGERVSGRPI
jgi:environmental stress-induced protein Ves